MLDDPRAATAKAISCARRNSSSSLILSVRFISLSFVDTCEGNGDDDLEDVVDDGGGAMVDAKTLWTSSWACSDDGS